MENRGMSAKVTSNKKFHEGTLTVSVAVHQKLAKYKKVFTKYKKYIVQYDQKTPIELGSTVTIVACAPISRRKRFTVKEVRHV